MYNLPNHKENDPAVIAEFLLNNPFAFLSGSDANGFPVATQLPLLIEEIDGRKVVRGHIMKNTDHHKAFVANENVLAVFTGKHTYVSGTWYSNPHTPSTWNYMSVHIKGKIKFLPDEALIDILRVLSLHFEKNNPNSTTVFDNITDRIKEKVMGMIVAFEIEIEEMDTVFKLSQDRDKQSYLNIIEQLKKQGEDGQTIAQEMEKRTDQVFPA